MNIHTIFQRQTYFIADAPRGGNDGDDPWQNDEYLATAFKVALRSKIAYNQDTPNPFGLIDHTENILERAERVGNLLIMMGPALRPIAQRLLEIPGYSDKRTPGIIERKFQGFDLSTPQ